MFLGGLKDLEGSGRVLEAPRGSWRVHRILKSVGGSGMILEGLGGSRRVWTVYESPERSWRVGRI